MSGLVSLWNKAKAPLVSDGWHQQVVHWQSVGERDDGGIRGDEVVNKPLWMSHKKPLIPAYRGCSYYTGINTSGTNSKHHDFIWLDIIIRIQPIPTEMLLVPNQIICSQIGISSWFGISPAGINTRVMRAPPVCWRLVKRGIKRGHVNIKEAQWSKKYTIEGAPNYKGGICPG